LPVQHDGRWPPLDTVARDIVESTTGTASFEGRDPVLHLLAWTFDPETWKAAPLISIPQAELRSELGLPAAKSVFSFSELIGHRRFMQLLRELSEAESGRKLNPLESKVRDIQKKLMVLVGVFDGQAIRPIPDPDDIVGAWRFIESAPTEVEDGSETTTAVQTAWEALSEAFLKDDSAAFSAATDRLFLELERLPAAHRPKPELIRLELRYNKLRPFRTAWLVMLGGAVLSAVAMVVRRRWFGALAVAGMLAGFVVLTYGLGMRWRIAGRIPAANMFESLLFLSWGMGAFAIVSMFVLRHRIVPLTASAMGALALILADCLPMDHYVRPIAPVLLDTIWMSIHVPVIMVSYSVLALAVVIAHVQLVVMAATPRRRQLISTIDSLHYWYVHIGAILLAAGIITGSMWAASSWGRYWGWDPKEVWSLVAFVGYLAILHRRLDHTETPEWLYALGGVLCLALFMLVVPKLAPLTGTKLLVLMGTLAAMVFFVLAHGRWATAVKSIVAFWLIVMTYVGVNYVLGTGLHTYGFGTGAVVRYLFWVGGVDLALVMVCSVVYFGHGASPRAAKDQGSSPGKGKRYYRF
jgi:ABC-type transport system involved in cytochrome c biogenesis permease subunit